MAVILLLVGQLVVAQGPPRDLCSLFTAKEIHGLLGTVVENGESAAMGTGCQWFGKDEQSYVIIQMVGSDFWVDPRQAPGYATIKGLGKHAYSHADPEGGWRAMALTNDAVASVLMIGKTATRVSTVTLIRQLLERRSQSK